ncbi:MAG: hypothetical protein ACTH30_03615 [Leucobacter sp.]
MQFQPGAHFERCVELSRCIDASCCGCGYAWVGVDPRSGDAFNPQAGVFVPSWWLAPGCYEPLSRGLGKCLRRAVLGCGTAAAEPSNTTRAPLGRINLLPVVQRFLRLLDECRRYIGAHLLETLGSSTTASAGPFSIMTPLHVQLVKGRGR